MTVDEVLRFIEENDVTFVRLAFMDLFGRLKNMAIPPERLPEAFETGVAVDATAVDGYEGADGGDLLLRPDPDTLSILPWRPQTGRVCRLLCGLTDTQGKPFEGDGRAILRRAMETAAADGLDVRFSTGCGFYLLDLDDEGRPTWRPHDHGGYMDMAPLDRCEDIRRDICMTLEEMNIHPESSLHERGCGQNGIALPRTDPMSAADHYVSFLQAARAVSMRYGVHATFLPKPLAGEPGNGLCVGMSLYRGPQNLLRVENGEMSGEAKSAISGILRRLPEMTLFCNPLPNGYERLADGLTAGRLCWSYERDASVLRTPLPQGRFARVELASPDPTMNVYLGFALMTHAALEGIASREKLDADRQPLAEPLPQTLNRAAERAARSAFIRRALPELVVERFAARARALDKAWRSDPDALLQSQLSQY